MIPFEPEKDLRVVMACESSANADLSCDLLERVGHESKAEGRLIYSWWTFDVLTITLLRGLAAREAAEADLVVIAASDRSHLPDAVHDWIRKVLLRGTGRSWALVALLDSHQRHSQAVGAAKVAGAAKGMREQLAKVAEMGRMKFFAGRFVAEHKTALTQGFEAMRSTHTCRESVRRDSGYQVHRGGPDMAQHEWYARQYI